MDSILCFIRMPPSLDCALRVAHWEGGCICRTATSGYREEKNIFPFQEEADVVFNSALIYEFSVLKIKALPELYQLSEDPEVGETAKRLIKTLNYFLGVDTEIIPKHSLVREFIGGSVLDVG